VKAVGAERDKFEVLNLETQMQSACLPKQTNMGACASGLLLPGDTSSCRAHCTVIAMLLESAGCITFVCTINSLNNCYHSFISCLIWSNFCAVIAIVITYKYAKNKKK
jgi:hypothetical protein